MAKKRAAATRPAKLATNVQDATMHDLEPLRRRIGNLETRIKALEDSLGLLKRELGPPTHLPEPHRD